MSLKTSPAEAQAPAAAVTEPGRPPRAFPRLTAFLLLGLATVAIFRQHLFGGHTFAWDFLATTRWAVFVTSAVGSGHFSEWVPFAGGGFPVAECAGCGLYSPLWWAMGLLHIPATLQVLTTISVAHVFIGAFGVFLLARQLLGSWRWALLAGLAFVFFGGFFANATHDVILRGHAYAPWLLWILTLPPAGGTAWRRIFLLPLWTWLMATMAYPGQTIAFLLVGAVYLAVQLVRDRAALRRVAWSLAAALVASMAVLAAAYLPYIAADSGGRLFRPYPPGAAERTVWALHPVDLFGLYLNPFAWSEVPATITAWAVGIVSLIGLGGLTRKLLREQAPLAAAGAVALALAMLPAWLPAGRLLSAIPLLFPSRLPASDYKALAAVALIVLGALGWSRLAGGENPGWGPAVLVVLVLGGLWLAPQSRGVPPTKLVWLAALVAVVCLLIAYRGHRVPATALLSVLIALCLVDGFRIANDLEIFPGLKVWSIAGADFPDRAAQNTQARELRDQLASPPVTRPERAPVIDSVNPVGSQLDAIGYLGTGYRLGDYGGTITLARHRVQKSPELTAMMLKPWTAWVVPCSVIDCSARRLALPGELQESPAVRTTAYGLDRIDYSVDLAEPSLMIENEIFAPGWSAARPGVKPVEVAGALRGWVLPAGSYEFSTHYRQPERTAQLMLVGVAVLAMLAGAILYRRAEAGVSLTLAARSCPVCGSEQSRVVAEEKIDFDALTDYAFASRKLPEYMHYRLVECESCKLAYANPAPEAGALGEVYKEAAYDSAGEARCAARTYARRLPALTAQLPSLHGALDIGAGDGAFLQELLTAGFTDVVGIEPSTAPIEAAAPSVKGLIKQGLFAPGSLEKQSLALVTCFQTIEHLPDPGEMFRQIHDLLVPGGAVYIVCHNRLALSAKVLGERSPIFDIEHLQLFSTASLRFLLESAGFENVEVKTVVNRYPLRYWARLFPLPAGLKSMVLGALKGPLGAPMLPLPAGNISAIGYTRAKWSSDDFGQVNRR